VTLAPGTTLGPYEVVALIGAGGMGEVYRARDRRLDRSVAIKVLASEIAGDPDLRARFEREARAVAALDHPHICSIYDVGEANGTHFLVMPHLEGQTLAARLAKGPLPVDQALKIAIEIADALDTTHRRGITHRDLKPANIMLTKAGAKLLDFGLAKLKAPAGPITMSGMTRLVTSAPAPGTATGTILGTVPYLAPEQVEGKEADALSDIWALGAIIYEMIVGTRPFHGDTPASVIGSILKDVPLQLSTRIATVPPALDHLVDGCLAKEPDRRWQSAADVARELEWIARTSRDSIAHAKPAGRRWFAVGGWLAAALVLFTAFLVLLRSWSRESSVVAEPITFRIYPPPGLAFEGSSASVPVPQLAVSPDGRHVAYIATRPSERPSLWLRTLSDPEARQLPDTENADIPFWSPDSRTIAFAAQGVLKKRDITSTAPSEVIATGSVDMRGGAWSESGTIVYIPTGNVGAYQTNAAGGAGQQVVLNGAAGPYRTVRWPYFLPGGERFLFHVRHADTAQRGIYVGGLDSAPPRRIIDSDFGARYALGHALYLTGQTLLAQPFDLPTLQPTGPPTMVAQPVAGATTGLSAFSVSTSGVLAFSAGLVPDTELRWIDRAGRWGATLARADDYPDFRLSPDNTRLAFSRTAKQSQAPDVWVLELQRGTEQRLTNQPLTDSSPQWSPDGAQIMYRSNRAGANLELFILPQSGAGTEPERIWSSDEQSRAHGDVPANVFSTQWSPNGKYIIYHVATNTTGYDLWALRLEDRQPIVVSRGRHNEAQGELSPNNNWIAFASDESGRYEIYVQSFPDPNAAPKTTVSVGGGTQARWSEDGRELFFLRSDGTLMSVPVRTNRPTLTLGAATPLFRTTLPTTMNAYRMDYVPANDGQRFVMKALVEGAPPSITIVLNWQALLKK
jgi:serine/threonine protein kinase